MTIPEGYTADEKLEKGLLEVLTVNVFAFCLMRGQRYSPGILTIAPVVAPSLFQSIPVIGKAHWGVKVTGFGAPGLPVANPCNPSCGAIVDSGTSLIAVPPSAGKVVEALKRRIARDCSNIHTLPVLRLEFGDVVVDLPPQAYVMQVMSVKMSNDHIWEAVLPWHGPEFEPQTTCLGAFMELSERKTAHGPMYIFGMPFMRYFYTVFDRPNKAIHVSKASPSCEPLGGTYSFTNMTNGSGLSRASTAGVASDYQPLQVDLNSAMAPSWAFEKDTVVDFEL